jgi:hypothetical protein
MPKPKTCKKEPSFLTVNVRPHVKNKIEKLAEMKGMNIYALVDKTFAEAWPEYNDITA